MDESVDVEKLDVVEPDGSLRLSQTQWLGLGGALATFVGLFTPLYGMLTFTITLASIGWPALVVGVAAVVAAWFTIRRRGLLTLTCGLVAPGVSLYVLIRAELDKASMNDLFPKPRSGNPWGYPFAGDLNEMVDAAVAPQWGWAVLLLGIGAILISGWAQLRSGRRSAA